MDGDALVDTRYGNRTVTLNIRVVGSSQSDIEDRTQLLQAAITKLHREGGVLEGTSPAGTVFYLTVLDAQMTLPQGKRYMTRLIAEPTLEFTCSPFIYGSENSPSDHVETSSPCLIFTEASVAGDVPALGRLVIDNDESPGADQAWLVWGLRSKTYDSDADAALYYDAVGRTAQGAGAATSTAASGYTGSGSVLADKLSTQFESILSTQATGGGSHLQHTGAYRVFARYQAGSSNSGTVGVALEWAVGDFRDPTRNSTVYLTEDRTSSGTAINGSWLLVDHGIVRIPSGSTQWEGRFLATGTALNDDLHIDHFFLVPVDEGYGQASSVAPDVAATAYTARSTFTTESGAITGDSLTTGGTWTAPASAYEADDFSAVGFAAIRAPSGNDTSTDARYGRWVYASGTSAMTATAVQADVWIQTTGCSNGVVARAVDKDNFLVLRAGLSTVPTLTLEKFVSGTKTTLMSTSLYQLVYPSNYTTTVRLVVFANGVWHAYMSFRGTYPTYPLTLIGSGIDSSLATGGDLDDGYAGIHSWVTSTYTSPGYVDSFYVWVPVSDAACFASRSARVKYDGVMRQDSAGSYYAPMSDYTGDYLLVPPAGRESRTTQVLVKMCRTNPYTGTDGYVDDLSAKLYVTPRYLSIPT